ncbi:MAG: methanogenesis marker 16 metalloprotein [Methanocorpusculum sp.]|nr:methanogenesis marker 16 metalloprotein [Methanocorpusculum sp.]
MNDTIKKTVLTAAEYKARVRAGTPPTPGEVDVVTCGTFGIMSGTSAVLSFPAAPAGTFTRAESLTLNGVPASIGPCPNERNGHVDCVVFGTSVSVADRRYSGGHLFRDLAAEQPVHAKITTDTGVIEKDITVSEMTCARLLVTRGAFKNYTAFVNAAAEPMETIFSVVPVPSGKTGATFSGCGEINPLENDPSLRFHKAGKPVLVNGAPGVLLGTGTRSSAAKPNLSAAADIRGMHPNLMGGFSYPSGAECLTSIATAIPVADAEAAAALSVLDEDIPLPIADVADRIPFDAATYADAWAGDARVKTHPENCTNNCDECAVTLCPNSAITPDRHISGSCMGCLTCVFVCPNKVFEAARGTLHGKTGDYPVILRQSDRVRGNAAAALLKKFILDGAWEEF